MTIWKYELESDRQQAVHMPMEAQILSVAMDQSGRLCLWALVDPDANFQQRVIEVVGTGRPVSMNERDFIGTVVVVPFVWHVFEIV